MRWGEAKKFEFEFKGLEKNRFVEMNKIWTAFIQLFGSLNWTEFWTWNIEQTNVKNKFSSVHSK